MMVQIVSQPVTAQDAARILFLFKGGNCEQAVCAAVFYRMGMPLEDALAAARNGAAGGERTVCGVLIGANRVLEANCLSGMKEKLESDFKAKFGSILCSDLNMADVAEIERRKGCMKFIEFALQETLEILDSQDGK